MKRLAPPFQVSSRSMAAVLLSRARRSRGFTLLEVMIVLAIVGVITAISVTSAQQIGARNATQNAASDLSTVLQNARARAEQSGADVYVMVYPTMKRDGSLTGGSGALVVYEDARGDFLTATGPCDGSASTARCGWTNFAPPSNVFPVPNSGGRFVQIVYLDDYPKKNVRFGKSSASAFTAPFTGVGTLANANGCSFCGATKGAIVFTGEQQLRFLDNSGAPVAQRVAGLAVQAVDNPNNTFLWGLVSATGLVTTVK